MRSLIGEYKDIFRKIPGRLSIYEHEMVLHDHTPVFKRPYAIAINARDKVNQEINKMLKYDIIQASKSNCIIQV